MLFARFLKLLAKASECEMHKVIQHLTPWVLLTPLKASHSLTVSCNIPWWARLIPSTEQQKKKPHMKARMSLLYLQHFISTLLQALAAREKRNVRKIGIKAVEKEFEDKSWDYIINFQWLYANDTWKNTASLRLHYHPEQKIRRYTQKPLPKNSYFDI